MTDQAMLDSLRSMARDVARRHLAPRAEQIDAEGKFPWDIAEVYKQNGLLSFMVPEEYGGAGGDVFGETIIAEELAKVCVSSAILFTDQCACTSIMNYIATPEQKQHYLPRVANGELLAIALTEPDAGTDAAALRTSAQRTGDGRYRLNGLKHFCTNGDVADMILTFAVTAPGKRSRGISVFALEKATPGFQVTRHDHKMGLHGTTTVEFVLEDCELPESARLGPENEGFGSAMYSLERGRVAIGGVAVGLAQGALEYAAKYAVERKQFGQPIASFQGLQFMLADMAIEIEAARRLLYHAAELAVNNHPSFRVISAKAKCFATDVAMKVTTDAVQILGGMGYIRGCPVERMMRDAKILQIFEGTNQLMRVLVARDLVGRL